MNNLVRVGMADYKICRPPQYLSTLGLGSCMGIVLYDPVSKWCGMAHVMLPDSKKINHSNNRMKFADTCLEDMLEELLKKGANRAKLVAKIAGGARMFAYTSFNEHLNIGENNIEATRKFLSEHKIPIAAEDVGEFHGRTIEFYPEDGSFHIKTVGQGISIM